MILRTRASSLAKLIVLESRTMKCGVAGCIETRDTQFDPILNPTNTDLIDPERSISNDRTFIKNLHSKER